MWPFKHKHKFYDKYQDVKGYIDFFTPCSVCQKLLIDVEDEDSNVRDFKKSIYKRFKTSGLEIDETGTLTLTADNFPCSFLTSLKGKTLEQVFKQARKNGFYVDITVKHLR